MIEIENYIMKKMERAQKKWRRAYEKYKKGNMRTAAILYAEAMRLYYSCAIDLIDGTGFKEVKGGTK